MGTQPTLQDKSSALGCRETRPLGSAQRFSGRSPENRKKNPLPSSLPGRTPTQTFRIARNPAGKRRGRSLCGTHPSRRGSAKHQSHRKRFASSKRRPTSRRTCTSEPCRWPGRESPRPRSPRGVEEMALAAGGNLAFPVIATINGQTLHNHYHGNTLKEGEIFLLDAGAETAMGYAGDLSSTMPVSAISRSARRRYTR